MANRVDTFLSILLICLLVFGTYWITTKYDKLNNRLNEELALKEKLERNKNQGNNEKDRYQEADESIETVIGIDLGTTYSW